MRRFTIFAIFIFAAVMITIGVSATAVEYQAETISDMPSKPDLIVKSVTFDRDNGKPVVTLRNIGKVTVKSSSQKLVTVSYQWTDEQGNIGGPIYVHLPKLTLKKNQNYTLKFPATYNDYLTSLRQGVNLTVTVDSDNEIDEQSEENNVWEGAIAKPDLKIESVAYNFRTKKLTVWVKNVGTVRAGDKALRNEVRLAHWWTNEAGDQLNRRDRYLSSLAVNARSKVEWAYTPTAGYYIGKPEGAVLLNIKIDDYEIIAESNEANNLWTGEVLETELRTCVPDVPSDYCPTGSAACTDNGQPVCGTDGVTYIGRCLALYGVAYDGFCINNGTPATPSGSEPSTPTPDTPAPETPSTPTPATPPASEPETPAPSTPTPPATPSTPEPSTPATPPAPTTPSASALPRANCIVSVEPNPVSGGNYDLNIKSGSTYYKPIPAIAGQWLQFRATIMNVGTDSTGPRSSENIYSNANIGDSDFYLCVDTNDDGLWDVVKTSYTNPLAPQHYALKGVDWFEPFRGTFRYQLCADGGNKVIETDENNNCYENTITIQ